MDELEESLTGLASDLSPETPNENKREHYRLPVHWQAAVMFNQKLAYGKLGDISRGGVTFLADANLPIGSRHVFYIRMPTPDRLSHHQLEASVQVCNNVLAPSIGCYRIGMRFLEMRGNTEPLLTQYLNANGG